MNTFSSSLDKDALKSKVAAKEEVKLLLSNLNQVLLFALFSY